MFELSKLPEQRLAWTLVLISVIGLEAAALFFQYSFELEPCIKCIYQRLAILGIGVSAVLPLIQPAALFNRILGYCGYFLCAGWGLKIAIEHVEIQKSTNPFFTVCDTIPDFPSWFNPHIWLPDVFEPRGDCDAISWQFLNLSMPQWMIVLFAGYIAILALVLTYRFLRLRRL